MTKIPLTPYEQLSYDLNLFRERRIAERRKNTRNTPERRKVREGGSDMPSLNNLPEGMH